MSNYKVSIIVPFYNRLDMLEKTIQSVLQQTVSSWELILVDDGSTEDTSRIIEKHQSENIRFYKRERLPKGGSTSRNIGASHTTSSHLLFLDSDDLLANWCVESRLNTIKESPSTDIYVFEGIEFDNAAPNEHRLRTIFNHKSPLDGFLSFQSIWQTSCVVWTKKLFDSIKGWDENALSWQDGEIHIRALLKNPEITWGSAVPDVFIRKHDGESRISNQVSITKFSRLHETYHTIINLLKSRPDLQAKFNNNIESSLFTNVEGHSKSFLIEYKNWIDVNVSNPKLKRSIIRYIRLYQRFGLNPFFKRALYQLRKIGIPNKRILFWSIRPQLTDQTKNELISKLNKNEYILKEVKFITNNLTSK